MMICAQCHAESESDFDFCPKCGQKFQPLLSAPADRDEVSPPAPNRRIAILSVAVSSLTLISYLLIPYFSAPVSLLLPAFSIDGWQMNWLPSWEFWPTAGRWLCLSLIILFIVAVLQLVRPSRVTFFAIQIVVSTYLIAAMTRLFITVNDTQFGELINPWIILLGATALFILAAVGLVERLGLARSRGSFARPRS